MGDNGWEGWEAFRWTQATGMVGLWNSSSASGVSADGSVVVGTASGGGAEAFRWTQATGMVGLGNLPWGDVGAFSSASGVSADGSVVVGYSSNYLFDQEAFRWTQTTGMVGLGGSLDTYATGVSADGSVVVGYIEGYNESGFDQFDQEAFRWTQATGMVGLGNLSGWNFSSASGVSADGSVVVGSSSGANGGEAFIWNSTQGMRSLQQVLTNDYGLNLTGWSLYQANAISADGLTVVGEGTNGT